MLSRLLSLGLIILFGSRVTLAAPDSILTSSNLPIVIINTYRQTIPDEPKITADMGIIDNGPGKRNSPADSLNGYNGKIGIEVRGSSSQSFPKKQYAVETRDSLGNELSVSLLGLPAETDWVLYAVYNDKSLIRDALMFNLGRSLGRYQSRARFCEVILNGDYVGVYVLLEKISRNKNRVNITKIGVADTLGDAVTGGYIVKIDKTEGEETAGWYSGFPPFPWASQRIYYQFHYPKAENLVWPQRSYITLHMRDFEIAMHGSDYADTATGYPHWLDVDAFVDYVLLNEFSKNVDEFRLSFFMYKDRESKGGKLIMGPLWDYTLGFGNCDYYDASLIEGFQWKYLTENASFLHDDMYQVPFWVKTLLNDPTILAKLRQRWNSLRSDKFSFARITNVIDSLTILIDESQQRNFERWPIFGQYVWPNAFVGNSYAEEIDYMKSWIGGRLQWMDQAFIATSVGGQSGRSEIPGRFELEQNYPNPFNPETVIKYTIGGAGPSTPSQQNAQSLSVPPQAAGGLGAGKTSLVVYDVLGREVATIVDEVKAPGTYQVRFSAKRGNGNGLSSGVYVLRLTNGAFSKSRTMVLLR